MHGKTYLFILTRFAKYVSCHLTGGHWIFKQAMDQNFRFITQTTGIHSSKKNQLALAYAERQQKKNALSVVCNREKSPHWTLKYGNLITHYSLALNFLLWNSRIPARHKIKKIRKWAKGIWSSRTRRSILQDHHCPRVHWDLYFYTKFSASFSSCFLFCWFSLMHLLHAIPTEKPPVSCVCRQPSTSGSDPWRGFLHATTAETETAEFPSAQSPFLPLLPQGLQSSGYIPCSLLGHTLLSPHREASVPTQEEDGHVSVDTDTKTINVTNAKWFL